MWIYLLVDKKNSAELIKDMVIFESSSFMDS